MPRIRAQQLERGWKIAAGPNAEAVGEVWLGLTGDQIGAVIVEAEYRAEQHRMQMEKWGKDGIE